MDDKKLAETLRQLRLIVVKFADDCVHAFPEIARAHEEAFRFYLKFGSAATASDRDVFAVYDYMCRKLPERAHFIWFREEKLFDAEFIAHHGFGDCEFLPRLDFRHFFFATAHSEDAREQLWLYIQGMLMLTMNESNRHLAEMQARSARSLEDIFALGEEGGAANANDQEIPSLLQMLDQEEYQSHIEDIVNRLNAQFATGETAPATAADEGDGMDTDGGDDAAAGGGGGGGGSAFPAFDSDRIKQFLGSLTDTKFGRLAKEVVEEFMAKHPELEKNMEAFAQQQQHAVGGAADASSFRKTTSAMLRFLLSNKCISMRELFALMSARLREKVKAGEFTYDELRRDFPKFMQNLAKMSPKNMQELAKAAGVSGSVNTERLRRELSKEQCKDRMRQKLIEKKRRETDAMLKLSSGLLAGGFEATDAYDHLRHCNLSDASVTAAAQQPLSHEEQQRQWKQTQEEVLALFADGAGIASAGAKAPTSSRARKQGKR